MSKIIGFNQGQYGDLFINLVICRIMKKISPNEEIVYSVNKRYKDVIPILNLSDDIDGFIVWENYEDWPSETDKQLVEKLRADPEVSVFFNPMPQHPVYDWYNYWHIAEETCLMNGLQRPSEEDLNFSIKRPDLEKEDTITICAASEKREGATNKKALNPEQIEVIKKFTQDKNLKLIQIGGPDEEEIDGAEKFKGNYSESVLKVLKSRFLVCADTGMSWAASAFAHPCIVLYTLDIFDNFKNLENLTPKNKNQKTISGLTMKDIKLEELEKALQETHKNTE